MSTAVKQGKKWYAVYVDASGKQKWKVGYHDKAETQRLARKLEDEARSVRIGDVDPQVEARRIERARPVDLHIADYKAKLQAAGRSPGHIAYTVKDIEALVTYGAVNSASDITLPLVDRWVLAFKKDGDANKTINRRVGSVQQFLRHLAEVGGVTKYLLNRYPKLPTGEAHKKRFTRALSREELETLLTHPSIPEARRQLYTFASKTGLRMSEARHVAPAWFDLGHYTLTIPAHISKAKRDQTIPLHPSLATLAMGKPADLPIFTMPSKRHVIDQLRADCRAAGVDTKNVGFHALRHTFCTLLARANVHPALLQKLARHAHLDTTLRYYVHLQRSDEAQAIAML